MANQSPTQQRFSILEYIDELADPYLDEKTVVADYKELSNEVNTQLDDAVRYNDNLATVRKKIALSEPLRENDVQTLRQALFSALIVKEQNLTEDVNKQEKQSAVALGFGESLNSVNNKLYENYLMKKGKRLKFYEDAVNAYCTKMNISGQQKKDLLNTYVNTMQEQEKERSYRPLNPDEYVRELDKVAVLIVPKETYIRNKARLIQQQLQEEERLQEDQHQREEQKHTGRNENQPDSTENTLFNRQRQPQEEPASTSPSGTSVQPVSSEKRPPIITPHVQEQYMFRQIYSDRQDHHLRDSYESFLTADREEELYTELQRTIINKQKVPIQAVPFVAIEAAALIIAKEKPQLPAKQVLEEATIQARAFVAVQGAANTASTTELTSAIREIIKERNDIVALKQMDGLLVGDNKQEILRELQRKEIRENLVQIVDHINDNEFLKEKFGDLVNHPFFAQLTSQIKTPLGQKQSSSSGLFGAAAGGGSKILSDAANTIKTSPTETPVEQTPVFHFLLTNERLMKLSKENPEVHKRLMKVIPIKKDGFPLPQDSVQALFALAIASQDPHKPMDIKHFHNLLGSQVNGLPIDHPNYQLYMYMDKLLKFQEKQRNTPEAFHDFSENFITKTYLIYLFSKNPDFSSDNFPRSLKNMFGDSSFLLSFLQKAGYIEEVSSTVATISDVGLKAAIGKTVLSSNPILLLGSTLLSAGGGLFRFLTGRPKSEKESESNVLAWIVGSVVVIFIAFLLMGNTTDIQRISTPTMMAGGHGMGCKPGQTGEGCSNGQTGVDCDNDPTNPLCTFGTCVESAARSCSAPSCGCISQGVNGTHSHAGYNAVDIGIGNGHAGSCNGELNPLATSPIDSATVIFVGVNSSYGNVVVIQSNTPDAFQLLFGHLASFAVTRGQILNRGDAIGRVNNTGNSTGTHLHFERRDKSGALAFDDAMAAAGVYRNGLPSPIGGPEDVRSLLPPGQCF